MTHSQHTVLITPEFAGERLDKALPQLLPDITRSRLQSLVELGHIALSGPTGNTVLRDGALKVKPGQIYTVVVPKVEEATLIAQKIDLDIIFEDAHFLVINKPAGMVVHPAPGNADMTLVNALLAHCGDTLSGIGGVARPGLVHRIDKDTTGLLVVAKHDSAYQNLSAQLAERSLKRTYNAVVWGVPVPAKGTVTGDIGRHPHHRQKMAIVQKNGKHAVTHYKLLENLECASLVECELDTGRTHQIRVHMTHIKHPLVGDQTYGKPPAKKAGIPEAALCFPRQALHAAALRLKHPATGADMQFAAPLPDDMQQLLIALKHSTA
jgi:23S rRNA pseudouridine1911/1915/1917 synthase